MTGPIQGWIYQIYFAPFFLEGHKHSRLIVSQSLSVWSKSICMACVHREVSLVVLGRLVHGKRGSRTMETGNRAWEQMVGAQVSPTQYWHSYSSECHLHWWFHAFLNLSSNYGQYFLSCSILERFIPKHAMDMLYGVTSPLAALCFCLTLTSGSQWEQLLGFQMYPKRSTSTSC